MLRLTAEQLTRALNGLNPSEKRELLQLLEERDRAEAERPIDDSPSFDELFRDTTAEEAAASADPEGFLNAHAAHMECYERHAARLEAERPEPSDLIESMEWFRGICEEASARATADGFPPARDVFLRKP